MTADDNDYSAPLLLGLACLVAFLLAGVTGWAVGEHHDVRDAVEELSRQVNDLKDRQDKMARPQP